MSIDLTDKNLSFDEAVVAFTTEYPFLSEADVRGFFACTDDERALIIKSIKDAEKIPSASGWQTFLAICAACIEIAGLVVPIINAIQSIYGVAVLF